MKKFNVTRTHLNLMRHYRENYNIYRVLNTGTEKARVLKIVKPAKLMEEGKITIEYTQIRI